MVEKKQRFWLPTEKVRALMKEFDITEPTVRNVLNQKSTSKFARIIMKRALEMGAKKQIITIETED